MVDERSPLGIVGGVAHEQGRAGHGETGAEFLVEHQAAGGMQSRAPIVGVLQAPFQDGRLRCADACEART